jgi:hypothetical protein
MVLCGCASDDRRSGFFVWLHNVAENEPGTTIDSTQTPLPEATCKTRNRDADMVLNQLKAWAQ